MSDRIFTLEMDDGLGRRFALRKLEREAYLETRRGDPTVTFKVNGDSFTMTQAGFSEMVRLVQLAFATGMEAEYVKEWEQR